MDNYKIKVKDEAESKEAQELFFELGYSWSIHGKTFNKSVENGSYIFPQSNYFLQHGLGLSSTEITFPQLRDLVVLKRNKFIDATHTDQDGWKWFISSDNKSYVFGAGNSQGLPRWDESSLDHVDLKPIQTAQAVLNNLDELREEYKDYHKDPALISGADALRALADGEDVQVSTELTSGWDDDTATYSAEEILAEETAETDDYNSMKLFFRLKPQTIKLDLEIPAPYKAKIGGRDDTSFVLSVGRHEYCYKNEEDYTKARDALEAVFEAALRGTNS